MKRKPKFVPTHKTKKGFGGLLKKGLPCRIVQTDNTVTGKILIEVGGGNEPETQMYWGKPTDLTKNRKTK